MKASIYCRVSTQDQSLEQQKHACIDYCTQHNWQYEVFEEKISGAKQSRPEIDKMLQRVRSGEFSSVVVWKLDRLGRSTLHLIQLIEEFRNKNIQFIAVTQNIDTASPQGKFFLTVLAAFAELERELIKERTNARIDHLKAQGKTLGRPTGSKDTKERRKSGYWLRWTKKSTPTKTQEIPNIQTTQ